jgi:hypothetical protein
MRESAPQEMKRFTILCLLPAVAYGCGFTVHMLNSHRALSAFASTPLTPSLFSVLTAHRGALYAGSPYPDYLYACGPNHDDGEYSHWSPFQAQAAKYIREAYPAPRNASGDALVAFLAGVVSHYMADISWHGLAETPGGYGLIEHIGALDFNGTGGLDSAPHTECDTGAEFVAVYENAVPWDDPTAWVIPVQDLLNIYRMSNRSDVAAASIEECAAIFFAGAEAVRERAGDVQQPGPERRERQVEDGLAEGLDGFTGRQRVGHQRHLDVRQHRAGAAPLAQRFQATHPSPSPTPR